MKLFNLVLKIMQILMEEHLDQNIIIRFYLLFIISIATTILDITFFGLIEISPINTSASLILWLPGLAVGIRRLHDINKSGWNVLWALTCIGILPLIYWNYLQVGDEGENLYGPDPFG